MKTVERNKTPSSTPIQTSLANNTMMCYNGDGSTALSNVDNRWIVLRRCRVNEGYQWVL